MFREPRTERPPAKMKDVGQSDRRIAESFYLIYGVIKEQVRHFYQEIFRISTS